MPPAVHTTERSRVRSRLLDPRRTAPDFFHFGGTVTFDYRIDLVDGRYVVGALSVHLSETAGSESQINMKVLKLGRSSLWCRYAPAA